MERLLFKNVNDGFAACSALKREMVLIDEPIHSKFFLLLVCCVCCLIHFSPAEVIFHPFAVTQRSSAGLWLWMSSSGYSSIFFFFLTAELKAVSQLFVFPRFNAIESFSLTFSIL